METIMPDLDEMFKQDAYGLDYADKAIMLVEQLRELSLHHQQLCPEYRQILASFSYEANQLSKTEDLLALPVRLFKHHELKSVEGQSQTNVKTLTSSGTTSQQVSKIFLDKQTSLYQTKALAAIMRSYIGAQRLPMIIVDTDAVIKNRNLFSARGGGILGLSNFGRNHLYLFDEDMNIKYDELAAFTEKHKGKPIFLFGFTFIAWHHLVKELEASGKRIQLDQATLVHSGGWKKLESEKVDNPTFKKRVFDVTGIEHIHNFYGMVEQMGSVYMECQEGHFHASNFSEIIIRDPETNAVLPQGEIGLIETISVLPHSYPGHAILTEDMGKILGVDDCTCGRKGTYFKVEGRLPKAEVRGCSDTYEA